MNNYEKYKEVRNASWQCLIDCKVTELPVSISGIADQLGIGLYEYGDNTALIRSLDLESLLQADGFSYADETGQLLIFFDQDKPSRRIRFTLAHELGHILLGHVGPGQPRSRLLTPKDAGLEREADMFAARLLEPACVLWGLGIHTAAEIAEVCNISLSAAEIRAERMTVLLQRGAWLKSPLERRLFEQFKPYIMSCK